MKIIANASPGYTFSQSQLSDFLTLAPNNVDCDSDIDPHMNNSDYCLGYQTLKTYRQIFFCLFYPRLYETLSILFVFVYWPI